MALSEQEQLFLSVFDDLEQRLGSNDPYTILKASGLLRQLLLDNVPLVDQVNKKHRLKVRFEVTVYDVPQDVTHFLMIDGLDPEDVPFGTRSELVGRDQFLAKVVVIANGLPITVREVILYEANVAGGVHAGTPKAEEEHAIARIAEFISVRGMRPTLQELRAPGRVVLRALEPLRAAVTSTFSRVALLRAAQEYLANPEVPGTRDSLLKFPLNPNDWTETRGSFSIGHVERVALALARAERYEEASKWVERNIGPGMLASARNLTERKAVIRSMWVFARCLESQKNVELAEEFYENSAKAEREEPPVDQFHLAFTSLGIATCSISKGAIDEARAAFEHAYRHFQEALDSRIDESRLALLDAAIDDIAATWYREALYSDSIIWYQRAALNSERRAAHEQNYERQGKLFHQLANAQRAALQLDSAQASYELAASTKARGDRDGKVDGDSVGWSLQEVGCCLMAGGRAIDALPWLERAIAEKNRGNVHGRVSGDSVGRALHELGCCLRATGDLIGANGTLHESVARCKEGDFLGIVDHSSVGRALFQLGVCLVLSEEIDEGYRFFELALAEMRRETSPGVLERDSIGRVLFEMGLVKVKNKNMHSACDLFLSAAEELRHGNLKGVVDRGLIGACFHRLGCHRVECREFDAALSDFRRAREEKTAGGVFGESLAMTLRGGVLCLVCLGHDEEAAGWEHELARQAQSRPQ